MKNETKPADSVNRTLVESIIAEMRELARQGFSPSTQGFGVPPMNVSAWADALSQALSAPQEPHIWHVASDAFTAGWKARGSACYPDPMNGELIYAWREYKKGLAAPAASPDRPQEKTPLKWQCHRCGRDGSGLPYEGTEIALMQMRYRYFCSWGCRYEWAKNGGGFTDSSAVSAVGLIEEAEKLEADISVSREHIRWLRNSASPHNNAIAAGIERLIKRLATSAPQTDRPAQ